MLKDKIGTFATVVGTAVVLYFITIGIAVDVMDDYIGVLIVGGAVPEMSQVNYVLAFYTVVITAAMVVTSRFMSDDLDVAWRALMVGLLLTFVVSMIGLAGYPGLPPMTADKWLLAPALFTVFVVKNPATFLGVEAGCIVVLYFTLSIKKELE